MRLLLGFRQWTFVEILPWICAIVGLTIATMFHDTLFHRLSADLGQSRAGTSLDSEVSSPDSSVHLPPNTVVLNPVKQEAAGLKVEPAVEEQLPIELSVAGTVEVDADHKVLISPRLPGIIRSTHAALGKAVKEGDLLVTLESVDVGTARLNLAARQRELTVARSEAEWRSMVATNVESLIVELRKGTQANQLAPQFADKILGEQRASLLSAFADYEMARHEEQKQSDLFRRQIIGEHPASIATHAREASQSKFEAILEQVRFDAAKNKRLADQKLSDADAGVIEAIQRLRILGIEAAPRTSAPTHPSTATTTTTTTTSEPVQTTTAESTASVTPTATDTKSDPAENPGSLSLSEDVSVYRVFAPFDGTITTKLAVPSQRVETTDVLYTLINFSKVRVVANVPESDYASVAMVKVNDVPILHFTSPALPGEQFEARVIDVSREVDPATRTVRVLAEIANPRELLRPGMSVTVLLERKAKEPVLTVPASAIVEIDGKDVVFVPGKHEHSFTWRAISAGRESEGRRVVSLGLKPGDQVVSRGAFELKSELILQNEPEEE